MKQNPFKMVGPWIGIGAVLLEFIREITIGSGFMPILQSMDLFGDKTGISMLVLAKMGYVGAYLFWFVIVIVSGFLLGWGVQAVIQRMR